MNCIEVLSIVPKCEEVICVEEEYSVVEWNEDVIRKFKENLKVDTERTLDTLMKWYIQTLGEHISCKSFDLWKIFMLKHIKFFKTYLMELNCLYLDNYLSNMENILVYYFEIELKSLSRSHLNGRYISKRSMHQFYNRITKIFYIYLLGQEDRVHHVLMKIKYEISEGTILYMNLIYWKLLTKGPCKISDLAFCRAYLLFQKWKKIRMLKSDSKNDIVEMELVLYMLYKKTPESFHDNPILKKILNTNPSSILDVLSFNEDDDDRTLMESYFRFFHSGYIQEGEIISDTLDIGNVQLDEDDLENLEEDEDFHKAYGFYLKSIADARQKIVDTIEIIDEDDGDCLIVEDAVNTISFNDDEHDDTDDVIFVPPESPVLVTEPSIDIPDDDDESDVVPQQIAESQLDVAKSAEIERVPTVQEIQPNLELSESSPKSPCRTPVIVVKESSTIQETNVAKESVTAVQPALTVVKKLVTTETQTDFLNQIDSFPTPSGSEDRNNDDPTTFDLNKPIVYAPILPVPMIDSDTDDNDISHNIRGQSPTTSQMEVLDKEPPSEVTCQPETSQNCGEDSVAVTTSEMMTSTTENQVTRENTLKSKKSMSPDSSQDSAKSPGLRVKPDKVMYTSPHKLKHLKDMPNWASIMGENMDDDDPFTSQVDGRLNQSDDKHLGIAENFDLYGASFPDDNNVSSSNYGSDSPNDLNRISSQETNKSVSAFDAKDVGAFPKNESPKKTVTLANEVSTSEESVPRVMSDTHIDIIRGILKKQPQPQKGSLYVNVEKMSRKKIDELLMLNEISTQITRKAFPNFSFQVCDFSLEKMRAGKNFNKQSDSLCFKNWRKPKSDPKLDIEDYENIKNPRSPKIQQEGMVTSNNNKTSRNNKYHYENNIPNQCKHTCCSSLTDKLCCLKISKNSDCVETILNLSSQCNSISASTTSTTTTTTTTTSTTKSNSPLIPDNPFEQKCERRKQKRKLSPEPPNIYDFCSHIDYEIKTPDTMSPNINLDLSFVSSIVENFDKESTDFILDLNPVILKNDNNNLNSFNGRSVTQLEEFDDKLIELVKSTPVASDLQELNTQKCLSSQSNSSNIPFVQELNNCALPENNEESNIDSNHQILIDNSKSDIDFSSTVSTNFALNNCENDKFVSSKCSMQIEPAFDEIVSENLLNVNYDIQNMLSEPTEEDFNVPGTSQKREEPFSNDNEESETRLPLKKRKLSSVVNNKGEEMEDEDFLGPDLVEEIIRRARAEKTDKEDISYPAKPMISIAEIQDRLAEQSPRMFKTPAEKKEMPPPPPLPPPQPVSSTSEVPPKIVTEQYNNLTYNNPTIYYHMNNVPYPFFPCGSLPYFPSFLLPMNGTTTIDMNVLPKQEQHQQQPPQHPQQPPPPPETQEPVVPTVRPKKEKKSRGRKKNN